MLDSRVFVTAVIAGAGLIPVAWIAWECHRRFRPAAHGRLTARGRLPARLAVAFFCGVGALAATPAEGNHHYSYTVSGGALTGHVTPRLTHHRSSRAAGDT